MELKIGVTIEYFIWSFICGILLALLYDFSRASRKIHNISVAGINIEDILYLFFSSGILFLLAYFKNNGDMRLQSFLGIILGFVFYRWIFHDLIVKLMVFLWKMLWKSIATIFNIASIPCRFIFRIISTPFFVIGWYSRSRIKGKTSEIKKRFLRRKKYLGKG